MNIFNFFKEKCLVHDDAANNVTNRMYALEPTVSDLQERNAAKLEKAKEYMGTKYILHPTNATKRKEVV